MNTHDPSSAMDEHATWNKAYDRLQKYLDGFMLSDRLAASRLALRLLDQARELHRQDPSRDPTTLVMEQTQKAMIQWLGANLEATNRSPAEIYSSGCLALFLSRAAQTAPDAFLAASLSDDLRQSIRQTLLVTGPDLNISSMTPRHLDYGPMLDLAKRTWHRLNVRAVLIAMLFWIGVYFVFYWWLSDAL